jgi:IclR family acetate operon transcriptional repressor
MPRPASPAPSPSAPEGTPDHHDFGGNRATARVLLILSQFTDGSPSHGVTELSRQLGMTKNMIHRALKTLSRYGYVVRDESGARYQLGPGVLQLGRLGLATLNLPKLTEPFLEQMQVLSGETMSLAIRSGRNVVTIAGLRGRGDIARRVPFGRIVPLHVTPACRAILAFLPDDEIDAYVNAGPLERFTPRTRVTPDEVWEEVRAIRARGYATAFADRATGATGLAFPVLASDGTPHGSVTIAGPPARLTDERLNELLPGLLAAMAELNRHSSLYPPEHPVEPLI